MLADDNSVLVPLTSSLYVRGELANSDAVLVDVGTGFLVEKVRPRVCTWTLLATHCTCMLLTCLQKLKSAEQFYQGKVQELTNSLKELEAIVQRKQANVRAVEEGMVPSPLHSSPVF